MSRQKDIRRALMLARRQDPADVLQDLATSRGAFAYGGAPFQFNPFVAPQYTAMKGATINPGAIAPPRPASTFPPAPTTMPTPTPSAGGSGGGWGGSGDRVSKAVRMAQKIAGTGMGAAPGSGTGSSPLNSATGGGNGGFSPSTLPPAPGDTAGDTTSSSYGGQYAGSPGLMGVGQAMAAGQAPEPGQVMGALAGLATGPAGLGISALGMGLNALGATPSTDPHGTQTAANNLGMAGDENAAGVDQGPGAVGVNDPNQGIDAGQFNGSDDDGGGAGGGGGDSTGGQGDQNSGQGEQGGGMYAKGGGVGGDDYRQGFCDGHEHARGGGLIQDKYPSHYMPGVGRQVMADGGTIDPDTGLPWQFDPSRIFAFADGGVVDRVLKLANGGKVNHAPTDAQKEAGNYKKSHDSFQGLPITIENRKGSVRSGVGANGKAWHCTQPADYGYIKRTEGADGDHVDVYLGPDKSSQQVFIVNQQDHKTSKFDEHKVMLGYQSEREAIKDYCAAFSDGKGPDRIRSIEPMSMDAFKIWLKQGNTKKMAATKDIVAHALSLCAAQKKGSRHV